MPSIFKKKAPEAPKAAPVDVNEMIQKINRQLLDAKQNQEKARENAKKAMTANNQVMAKQYMSQMKMYQVQEKNLTGQLTMLQMKQQQIATVEMAKQQVSLVKQLNQELVGTENVMDEMQDVLQESMEQQRQTQQMNEMMGQFADMQLAMMDDGNELDAELEMLAAEVQQEKLSGVKAPEKPAEVQAQPQKVQAANNMDELL